MLSPAPATGLNEGVEVSSWFRPTWMGNCSLLGSTRYGRKKLFQFPTKLKKATRPTTGLASGRAMRVGSPAGRARHEVAVDFERDVQAPVAHPLCYISDRDSVAQAVRGEVVPEAVNDQPFGDLDIS